MKIKKSISFKQKEFNAEEMSMAKHLFGLTPSDVYFNFDCEVDLNIDEANFINVYGLSGEGKTVFKEVIKEKLNEDNITFIDYDELILPNVKVSNLFDLKNDRDFIIRLFYTFGMFEMRNIFEYFNNLSNGQKTRIKYIKLIYNAYKNNTKVILIDEFLTFVDSLSSKIFVNSIKNFVYKCMPNTCFITFGCNDSIINYFEDISITMQNGKIIEMYEPDFNNNLENELQLTTTVYHKYHNTSQKKEIYDKLKYIDILQYHYFTQDYYAIRSSMIYALNTIKYNNIDYITGFESIQISGANKYWRSIFFGSNFFLKLRQFMKEKYGNNINAVFGTHARVVMFPQFRGIGLGKKYVADVTQEAFDTYPYMFMMEIFSSMLYNYDFMPSDYIKYVNYNAFESKEDFEKVCLKYKISSDMSTIKKQLNTSNVKLPMQTRMNNANEVANIANYMFKLNPTTFNYLIEYINHEYKKEYTIDYEVFTIFINTYITNVLSSKTHNNNLLNKIKQYASKNTPYTPIIIDFLETDFFSEVLSSQSKTV